MRSVCIVTSDIVGPVRNGGIGTHCYYLALTLARAGNRVSVLFTDTAMVGTPAHWAIAFAEHGIEFLGPDVYHTIDVGVAANWNVIESMQIYEYLRGRSFEVIHFQDWKAAGFHCIQAKRTLGEFAATLLTVTMHSPTEWQAEGMKLWPERPWEDACLQYCERYCCAFADLVIFPSQHMLDWCAEHAWPLAANRKCIPHCFEPGAVMQPPFLPEPGVVAFFGRLETRKGLEVFVSALKRIAAEATPLIKKVLFLGKVGSVATGPGDLYISSELAGAPFEIEIHSDLDTFAARALIRSERALVICPSLLDNSPFTVLECIMGGLPILAARTGGITEMLPPEATFPPTPRGIADAIRAASTRTEPLAPPLYDPEAAASVWRALGLEDAPPVADGSGMPDVDRPLVSICIPHYNYGRFVQKTLRALGRQTYSNIEIVLVDDGSTDAESRRVLAELPSQDFPRLTIEWQENAGPSAARNRAAVLARGDYLVFVDADNVPEPDMVELLLRAALHADLDIVTCPFRAFETGDPTSEAVRPAYLYIPLGPALEIGALANIFGDTNFLVRREIFLAEGGFPVSAGTNEGGSEDWEFLARAVLHGRRLDVVPKFLFWYRIGHTRRTTTATPYSGQRQILAHYEAAMAPTHPWLFRTLLYPLFVRYDEQRRHVLDLEQQVVRMRTSPAHILAQLPLLSRSMVRLTAPLDRLLVRLFPPASPIRRGLKKLLRRTNR